MTFPTIHVRESACIVETSSSLYCYGTAITPIYRSIIKQKQPVPRSMKSPVFVKRCTYVRFPSHFSSCGIPPLSDLSISAFRSFANLLCLRRAFLSPSQGILPTQVSRCNRSRTTAPAKDIVCKLSLYLTHKLRARAGNSKSAEECCSSYPNNLPSLGSHSLTDP